MEWDTEYMILELVGTHANSTWIIENEPKVAFVGDVVFSGTHSYMAETYYILIELNTFVYLH